MLPVYILFISDRIRGQDLRGWVLFIDIKTTAHFSTRRRRASCTARQKCWIAGKFKPDDTPITDSESEDSIQAIANVYYGSIDELWEIEVEYQMSFEQGVHSKTFKVARVA